MTARDEGRARHERILAMVREIPAGRVASYGQIAALAGLPRGARQVGRALRRASEPVPWHRVVTASGRIAFAAGSPSHAEQCARLAEENVPVIGGRVDMRRFNWQPGLDELLWRLP